MRRLPFGRQAELLDLDSQAEVHRVWAALLSSPPPGVSDVVAGARSVLVRRQPGAPRPPAAGLGQPQTVTIPAVYDGPDLEAVAGLVGGSVAGVVDRHSQAAYTVAFVGFSPGFAYLSGGSIEVPRLESPRTSVPAGSIAVAAGWTAVYPQRTPGGWRLLGRTDAAMFDPWSRPERPALLSPGDRVTFSPVPDLGPPAQPRRASLGDAGGRRVEVLSVGALMTVQDRGRTGWAHAGVPHAGFADRASAAAANRLAGNRAGDALFEVTAGGCRLRVLAGGVVAAVTGAVADVVVDGLPARMDTALALPAGCEVSVGRPRRGWHTYVALSGGLDTEPVLGSRSTDTLSGLGPAPLRPGDVVALGRSPAAPGPTPAPVARRPLPVPGTLLTVRARPGPRVAGASAPEIEALAAAEFTVSPDSDRTGARLDGPRLEAVASGTVPSEGMVDGAVQLPPGGRPVVLLRNHPATGGYPVLAVVDDGDVDLLAQSPPGVRVRFRFTGSSPRRVGA